MFNYLIFRGDLLGVASVTSTFCGEKPCYRRVGYYHALKCRLILLPHQ